MTLKAEAVLHHRFKEIEVSPTDKDCMLFALSIGLGRDPLERNDLRYVFEKDLRVFPTLAVVLGHPGPWNADPKFGVTRQMLVHGTERLEIERPLQCGATLVACNRVLEVVDKGADKGAIMVVERTLSDKRSGARVARIESGLFCRADGGFGGKRELSREFAAVPGRSPDASQEMTTQPNQALYYRLNGDRNPLHVDPEFAIKAGFSRPILHGLCTYSIAAACLWRIAGIERELRSIQARFSKPFYPGETIRVDAWNEGSGFAFRAVATERGAVVLDRGLATFT